MLLVNPQWTVGGNLVSDFGIFPWQRAKAEELVNSFTEVGTEGLKEGVG